MPIIGIEGGIGQGKTLSLTYFGLEEHFCLRKPLYANYNLYNGVPHRILTFEDLLDMAKSNMELMNACILLSEAHIWIDSRTANSKLNRLFTYLVLQTGKQDINLYYDTQDFGQVDKRLRQRTDIAIRVTKMANDNHLLQMVETATGKRSKMVINGPKVWPYYRTREVIRMGRTSSPPSGASASTTG